MGRRTGRSVRMLQPDLSDMDGMLRGLAMQMISRAYEVFKKTTDRPTLIIVDSHIGYGSPHKQDSNAAHGEPLGEDEVKLVKKFYGWPEDAKFLVQERVRE